MLSITTTGRRKYETFEVQHRCVNMSLFFMVIQAFSQVCFGILRVSHEIYGNNGTMTSPNFPGVYPPYLNILWNISTERGNQIKLNFTSFHLQSSKECGFDFVLVQDGPLPSSDAIVRICGEKRSDKIVFSTGPHLQIYLNTDGHLEFSGFQVFYDTVTLNHSFVEEIKRWISQPCPGLRNHYKKCKCVRVESDMELLYLRVDCSDLKLSSVSDVNHSSITILLDMSGNEIRRIQNADFAGLEELGILHLANNKIETIFNYTFKNLNNLHELDMSQNLISNIFYETLAGLNSLEELNLAENLLTSLDKNSFRNLSWLQILNLNRNYISQIDEGVFQKNSLLLELSLSGNELEHLHPNTFVGLQILFYVDLSNNHLKDLSVDTPSLVTSFFLYSLNLRHNQISEIPSQAFINRTVDGSIDLSNNHIETVHQDAFKGLGRANIILLGGNKISLLSNGTFSNMNYLFYLDLSRNRIARVDSHCFFNLPSIKLMILVFTSIDVLSPNDLSGPRDLVIDLTPAQEVIIYNVSVPSQLGGFVLGFVCKLTVGSVQDYLCNPCPLGTYEGMQGTCTACPAGGFYQDELAYSGTGCKHCPLGHFVTLESTPGKAITDCVLCPQGTQYTKFAGYKGCECLPNFYRMDRFGQCMQCPSHGLSCQNESARLKPGFYWKWPSNESLMKYQKFSADLLVENDSYKLLRFRGTVPPVYECSVTEACLGGMESRCSRGYEGPLCAVCSKGHYQLLNRCRKCPILLWFVLQVSGITIICAFLAASVFLGRKKTCASGRKVTDMMLARLKIVIGFYQVTYGTLNTFSYVEWPRALWTLVHYANIIQLNLLDIIPLQCIIDGVTVNAYTRLLTVVGLHTALLTLATLIYQLRKLLLLKKRLHNVDLTESLSAERTQVYRVVSLLVFVTYPWTCATILSFLSPTCQQICSSKDVCQSFLRADFTVQCFTEKYNRYTIAVYFLLLPVVVVPIAVLWLLWRFFNRRIYDQAETQDRKGREMSIGLSFLYENYARQCWFWEIFELIRKVWVTSILFLMGANTRSYLGAAAITSGFYTILVAYFKPIRDTFEHWLQIVALLANFVTLNVGMLLKIPIDEASLDSHRERDSTFVSVILVAVNVTVIAVMAVQYIFNFITSINHVRKNPQCEASCCITFIMIMVGAGEDAAGLETNDSSSVQVTPSQERNITELRSLSQQEDARGN
ncbi:putative leucine-rich repeat-containing protein DDB_G0281931 isoform X5 [Stylophora pistillata]|uniref:putative leucine-rich repeat-containing protein DDB_G0281931 isoform X5 n=1 Tax=Stylophora pistillata TaxID=50429 RepID=UPI000C03A085|nr:putative leucine-rich repeat-containing protein DDB_G0281931 isoform X5 [Stylophora pistillata]